MKTALLLALALATQPMLPKSVCGAAEGEVASPAAQREAKRLFRQGQKNYAAGVYPLALAEFEAALKLVRRPSIILNIAQCQRQLHRDAEALSHYRLYLEEWQRENPGQEVPFKGEVDKHIAALSSDSSALGAVHGDKVPPVRSPAGVKGKPKTLDLSANPDIVAPQTNVANATQIAPTSETKSSSVKPAAPFYRRWWFWTAVGAVAAGGAVTAVLVTKPSTKDPVGGDLGLVDLRKP